MQETSAEGDPQSNGVAESSVNVVKGNVRSIKLGVESASGVEVPVDLACAVCNQHAPSVFGWSRRQDSMREKFGETHRSFLGTVLVSECSGCLSSHPAVVRDLRIHEAHGSELAPSALEDDGGRVGIRAPALQPHAAVPLPPLVPEFRQVRRAPLRKPEFDHFGYTDNCLECANARAGQAVDHSEQCRSRLQSEV